MGERKNCRIVSVAIFFSLLLCSNANSQTTFVPDPIEDSFKLIYVVASGVIHEVQKANDAEYFYFGTVFVDSVDGQLCVGLMLSKKMYAMKKFLLIDSSGRVHKSWPWFSDEKIWGSDGWATMTFRYLDSNVYYGDFKEKSVLLGDSLEVVENPWTDNNLEKRYPSIFKNNPTCDSAKWFPLVRITRTHIYTLDCMGVVRVFESSLRMVHEIHMRYSSPDHDVNYFVASTDVDPFIGEFKNEVEFTGGYYDEGRQQHFNTSCKTDGYFAGVQIGEIKGESDYFGDSYFFRGDDFYRFLFTDKGLFVFKYEP